MGDLKDEGQSKEAQRQQATADASLDQYDRMNVRELRAECESVCTDRRPTSELSQAEIATCKETCASAAWNANEKEFRTFVRDYANNTQRTSN